MLYFHAPFGSLKTLRFRAVLKAKHAVIANMEVYCMKIAILGAGNVGTALGTGWARAGHRILFGVSNPQDTKHKAANAAADNAAIGKVAEVVNEADVVVLAVPWDAVPSVIGQCGSLEGKVIIDATNPLTFGK